jgi:hypothetical protein
MPDDARVLLRGHLDAEALGISSKDERLDVFAVEPEAGLDQFVDIQRVAPDACGVNVVVLGSRHVGECSVHMSDPALAALMEENGHGDPGKDRDDQHRNEEL